MVLRALFVFGVAACLLADPSLRVQGQDQQSQPQGQQGQQSQPGTQPAQQGQSQPGVQAQRKPVNLSQKGKGPKAGGKYVVQADIGSSGLCPYDQQNGASSGVFMPNCRRMCRQWVKQQAADACAADFLSATLEACAGLYADAAQQTQFQQALAPMEKECVRALNKNEKKKTGPKVGQQGPEKQSQQQSQQSQPQGKQDQRSQPGQQQGQQSQSQPGQQQGQQSQSQPGVQVKPKPLNLSQKGKGPKAGGKYVVQTDIGSSGLCPYDQKNGASSAVFLPNCQELCREWVAKRAVNACASDFLSATLEACAGLYADAAQQTQFQQALGPMKKECVRTLKKNGPLVVTARELNPSSSPQSST